MASKDVVEGVSALHQRLVCGQIAATDVLSVCTFSVFITGSKAKTRPLLGSITEQSHPWGRSWGASVWLCTGS